MGNKSALPERRPAAGVGIIVLNSESKILTGLRVKSGKYEIPGGHIEMGETVKQAAIRELREETGIIVQPDDLKAVEVMNVMLPNFHSVAFTLVCQLPKGQSPSAMEPKVNTDWDFRSVEELRNLDLYHVIAARISRNTAITKVTLESLDSFPEIETE